jgi:hypothetical protein
MHQSSQGVRPSLTYLHAITRTGTLAALLQDSPAHNLTNTVCCHALLHAQPTLIYMISQSNNKIGQAKAMVSSMQMLALQGGHKHTLGCSGRPGANARLSP